MGAASPRRAGPWSAAPRALAAALLVSVVAHGMIAAGLLWAPRSLPPVDFSLQLPESSELGLVETAPEPEAPRSAAEPGAGPAAEPPSHRAEEVARSNDVRRPALRPPRTLVRESKGPSPTLTAYAPAGTNVSLRVHLGGLRNSPIAPDVEVLLRAIPDWQAILGRSGLDPMRDLERLFLASPDLHRSKLVIAGEYVGGDSVARAAVARLARGTGRQARWREQSHVAVADWNNSDGTERVVALVGPGQFVITRKQDLARILGIAANAQRAGPPDASQMALGSGLLGMRRNELLQFAVTHAERFVTGNRRGVPTEIAATVETRPDGVLRVVVRGTFPSADDASRARDYWTEKRDRYGANLLVLISGLQPAVMLTEFRLEGRLLELSTRVTMQQARVVLGFMAGAIGTADRSSR